MTSKKSIYVSDRLLEVAGDLSAAGPVSLSGRINAIADRYGEIIAHELPVVLAKLSADELNMIKTVMWPTETATSPAGLLRGEIAKKLADSQDFELQDYPREAVDACTAKAVAMSPTQELALIEWLEKQRGA